MPTKFVVGLRVCCILVGIALAKVEAAEPSAASLVGASRAQVLERLGEPRSSIVAGNREVLLFERDRVVLRNNVVVEVDAIPVEPERTPPPEPPAAAEGGEGEPSGEAAAPTEEASGENTSPASRGQVVTPSTPAPPSDAPLVIRSVRPAGSSSANRPAQKTERPAAAPSSSAATPPVVPSKAVGTPPSPATSAASPSGQAVPATIAPSAANRPLSATEEQPAAATAPNSENEDATNADDVAPAQAMDAKQTPATSDAPQRREAAPVADLPEPEVFTGSSYVIAAVIFIGGIGYLIWRARQRRLELAATAVSRTPFAPPVAATAGARFTPELLSKLEWKRFEELVAAYYGKTGVVAVRTKSGPATPVHIKISWKGESRPFAFVQCIPHPVGLVDLKPIQELVAALAAEDIRRGYVVTTGKFNVPARDFAEEKHITLLPGDIFLEKLNALPDSARNELMQEIATGDYTTPSCPVCDAKMVRSPDDPSLWRCATHPNVVIPAWK